LSVKLEDATLPNRINQTGINLHFCQENSEKLPGWRQLEKSGGHFFNGSTPQLSVSICTN
jgi:hypothetical protein